MYVVILWLMRGCMKMAATEYTVKVSVSRLLGESAVLWITEIHSLCSAEVDVARQTFLD